MKTFIDLEDKLVVLKGNTIESVEGLEKNSEIVVLKFRGGSRAEFLHQQSCCENVWLEDFESPKNLIGSTIIDLIIDENQEDSKWGSRTWTFYKLMTNKGELFMRWCGESNGYYSEDVDIHYYDSDGNCTVYNMYY